MFSFCARLLVCLLIGALAGPAAAEDEFSLDGKGEYPPHSPQNRIIKWCNKEGAVRWASANLKIKGYEPCGRLKVASTCDASGNRLISSAEERPDGHLDCGVGPRIVIVNHGESGTVDRSNVLSADQAIEPLTSREQQELDRDVRRAAAKLQQDPAVQLNQALMSVLHGMVKGQASPGGSRTKRVKSTRAQQQQLREALKQLDPQTRKMVEEMIKRR